MTLLLSNTTVILILIILALTIFGAINNKASHAWGAVVLTAYLF